MNELMCAEHLRSDRNEAAVTVWNGDALCQSCLVAIQAEETIKEMEVGFLAERIHANLQRLHSDGED